MIGKTVSHYEIVEKLGVGGMGVVYKAHDTKLKRTVALKFLPPQLSSDPETKERFIHEAQAASALDHPNICTIHEIGETDDGQSYIAMSCYDGQSLKDIIKPAVGATGSVAQSMDIDQSIQIFIQIAQGLQKAHDKGIVHRDIKPANIMITDDGTAKILDFGLAKLAGQTRLTKTGSTVGTAAYMSPEQANGEAIDHRTDIWSLGVVMYEMLSGKLPFDADYEQAMIYSIINEEPSPVSILKEDVSSELEQIVNQCLVKDVNERYQTIDDLLIDLNHLNNKYPNLEKTSLSPPALSESKRRIFDFKLLTIVLTSLVLVFVLIKIFYLSSSNEQKPLLQMPFTSLTGNENYPAFSPDGNQIAFSWNGVKQENHDIYVKSIGSDTLRRLTNHNGFDRRPEWSPDGKYIAFCRDYEGERAIYTVSVDGRTEKRLHSGSWSSIVNLSWSPDGHTMVLSGKYSEREPYCIYMLHVEQLTLKKLTSPPIMYFGDVDCRYSPDGKMIAFNRDISGKTGDIYIMPVDDGDLKQLTFDNSWIGGLSWKHDSKEIVFSSNRAGGIQNLWGVTVSGGAVERLGVSGKWMIYPTVSKNGDRLAYEDFSINMNIYRIKIPYSNNAHITAQKLISSSRRDFEPEFSPDGSKIAFTSERSGYHEIWTCDSSGQKFSKITALEGARGGKPRWSPDGNMIVYEAFSDGLSDIFIIDSKVRSLRKITSNESDDTDPSWSIDGRWIYFVSNRSGESQIWRISIAGENPSQVTENGGNTPRLSLDGKWLFFLKEDNSDIFRCPAEGGEEEIFFDFQHSISGWCLSDKGIYYIYKREGIYKIGFSKYHSNESKTIIDLSRKRISWPTLSQDGQYLLFVQVDQADSDIMLVENFR